MLHCLNANKLVKSVTCSPGLYLNSGAVPTLTHNLCEHKLVQLCKVIWNYAPNMNMHLPRDPAVGFLVKYFREIIAQGDMDKNILPHDVH